MKPIYIAAFLAALSPAGGRCGELYIVHEFANNSECCPLSAVTETSPGVFVGDTLGMLFQVTSTGSFEQLYAFSSNIAGLLANGQLLPASDGNLYGVTGVDGPSGGGTVFRATAGGAVSVLSSDVYMPSPVVEASDGNLYGITGSAGGTYSFFRLTLEGTLTTLYTLGPNGSSYGPLVEASDGNFYGATAPVSGVAGIVYRLTPSGEFTVLHTFFSGEGGSGGLMQASNGRLYGSLTSTCDNDSGLFAIYSISLDGAYSVVHEFEGCSAGKQGNGNPESGLTEASDGNLYGTVVNGLSFGDGGLFRMTPQGDTYEVLFIFDSSDGASPDSEGPGVIQGSDGSIYGMTLAGGLGGGVVYRWVGGLAPPLPAVKLFQPSAGAPGSAIRITGTHLVGLSGVSFNGIAAQFTSRGDRYAYAVVPQGATSGPITVTTMNGSGTSKTSFTVE